MAQPYIGEIRMFAGNFPPNGWAFCEGQLIPISENDTLFTLLGTSYGGDGQETFALPDLRGRVPIHFGTGTDGINYQPAETGGVESVTLSTQQIPQHTHPLVASSGAASSHLPTGNVMAVAQGDLYTTEDPSVTLAPGSVAAAGGSQPHENMQPFLCVNFIISLFGVFPQQN